MTIDFERGFSDALPYPASSFDRVFSSFMFHHLERHEKEGTLGEIRRVLNDSGSLHLLDFGGREPLSGHVGRVRGLHSNPRLHDNDERTILSLLTGAGLSGATKTAERALLRGFVRIAYYRARKPLA